jgi:hypothetical protein
VKDQRRLLAFARDLPNLDYAGYRLSFQLFAQSPLMPISPRCTRNFDRDEPPRLVHKSADLSDRALAAIEAAQAAR